MEIGSGLGGIGQGEAAADQARVGENLAVGIDHEARCIGFIDDAPARPVFIGVFGDQAADWGGERGEHGLAALGRCPGLGVVEGAGEAIAIGFGFGEGDGVSEQDRGAVED